MNKSYGKTSNEVGTYAVTQYRLSPKSEFTSGITLSDSNPLLTLPFNVRESLTSDFYETGMSSVAQKFIENTYCNRWRAAELQNIFNSIYTYALKNKKHTLLYNSILILSQISYKFLGSWALTLAMAATRSVYIDIVELGIRCFENWENKNAIYYLRQWTFSESWLQKYANEVCKSIERKE